MTMTNTPAPDDPDPIDRARGIDLADAGLAGYCAAVTIEGLRYRNVLVLIAASGRRRGEALALHWSDVDLDAGSIAVRGTLGRVGGKLVISEPKTDRSRRTVPITPALV